MGQNLSTSKRIVLFFGGVIALITASILLFVAGLPDRSNFTGRIIEGVGRVAPEINALAPLFEQPSLSGDTVNLLDYRGETVIVNFWATWCTPCLVEMPALQTFHDETEIRIIGVNMGEQPSIVQQWIENNAITFDIALDPRGQVSAEYRLRGQPSTYVIAPDGIISHIFYGSVSISALRSAVDTHERENDYD